jgi:hypothetical protein
MLSTLCSQKAEEDFTAIALTSVVSRTRRRSPRGRRRVLVHCFLRAHVSRETDQQQRLANHGVAGDDLDVVVVGAAADVVVVDV